MPLYAYECDRCEHQQEEFFKISERNSRVFCGECGEKSTRIIMAKIERVEPLWLDDAVNHAVSHGSDVYKPRDRNEFAKFLKNNNLEHIG